MHSNLPDPLSSALRQWRVQPPRDAHFRSSVWQRLDQQPRVSWSGYVRRHVFGWSITAALALVAAGWGGHAMAQAHLQSERETMVISYLSGLDPRVISKLRP